MSFWNTRQFKLGRHKHLPDDILSEEGGVLTNPDNEVFVDTNTDAEIYQFSSATIPGILKVVGPDGSVRLNVGPTGYFGVFSAEAWQVYIGANNGSDLIYIQNAVGDETLYVKGNGLTELRPVIIGTSAPADDLLSAGQCALWFDATNGAAKLMIKAKQANGTVRTGSVNLT